MLISMTRTAVLMKILEDGRAFLISFPLAQARFYMISRGLLIYISLANLVAQALGLTRFALGTGTSSGMGFY